MQIIRRVRLKRSTNPNLFFFLKRFITNFYSHAIYVVTSQLCNNPWSMVIIGFEPRNQTLFNSNAELNC